MVSNPFALGHGVFDPSHRFETSWLVSPWVLFFIRATIALFTLTVVIFNIAWQATHSPTYDVDLFFSYFTNLTYIGLASYFLVAALHTFAYARSGRVSAPLDRWPRILQALHSLLYSSVTSYPFLVTIVFWTLIYPGRWYATSFARYSNISVHGLNSLFALLEVLLPRTRPQPWIHLFWLVVVLALYLALAYLTRATQGVYVYTFLDPATSGSAVVAGYILGILVGAAVLFLLSKLVVWARLRLTEGKKAEGHRGYHGVKAEERGDVEMAATGSLGD